MRIVCGIRSTIRLSSSSSCGSCGARCLTSFAMMTSYCSVQPGYADFTAPDQASAGTPSNEDERTQFQTTRNLALICVHCRIPRAGKAWAHHPDCGDYTVCQTNGVFLVYSDPANRERNPYLLPRCLA